jgi:hypothetical protein
MTALRPESPSSRATPATPSRPAPSRARFWAVELIPQYLLGAAALFFALTKWNAVRSAMDSMQAVAINTAVAVGWLGFSLVLMPWLVRKQAVRVVIVSIAAIALAWVLFANAYRDKTVVETLRGLDAPATAPAPAASEPAADTPTATTQATPAVPTGPVRLRSAALRGIDHRASGTASFIRQPDGSFVVGLEDIDIEPGPDYRVYVVPGDTERTDAGAVELDVLRGNQGTQFYDVPRDVDVGEGEWTVLVWCKRFAVPVAAAVPA